MPAKGGVLISAGWAVVVVAFTLSLFGVIGLKSRARDTTGFLTASGSQGTRSLALSFLASGMGAWILFAPPEVGAFVGVLGVIGYAIGAAAPIAAFGWIGRRLRAAAPAEGSIADFVKARFGNSFHLYVVGISILYMLIFLTAELTAIGGVTHLTTRLDGRLVVIAVALVTAGYTSYGGLRASLVTDRWQAWLILGALGAGAVMVVRSLPAATTKGGTPLTSVTVGGLEVAVTLVIAVTAANIFHQGYWQRVWAAKDDASLRRGATWGAVLTVPVVLIVGLFGVLAATRSVDLGDPPVPFFALAGLAPPWFGGLLLVLALSLVASSVDTLQNAVASLLSRRTGGSIGWARAVTLGAMVVPVLVALQGHSVLRLFLIADLLCAATVVPVLSGLSRRAGTEAALAGSLAGLLGAIVPSWIASGSLGQAFAAATFESGVPTIGPFLGALSLSILTTTAATFIREKLEAGGPKRGDAG
jgi:Na+/proline symporter